MTREEAKAIIEKLVNRFKEHQKDYHLSDYNEQKTRQDFINPFWKALGWDIDNDKGDSEAYREVIYEDKVVVRGTGSYKYVNRDDFGKYEFQIDEQDSNRIIVSYFNTVPSGLALGYEIWQKIK